MTLKELKKDLASVEKNLSKYRAQVNVLFVHGNSKMQIKWHEIRKDSFI